MTIQLSASGYIATNGVAHDRPHPQVWNLSASGYAITRTTALPYVEFPAASFDDFAFTTSLTDPDPVMVRFVGGSLALTTNSGSGAWVRPWSAFSVPVDYPVSTGNLWNGAAYVATGVEFFGVTTGKQQMLDAVQTELFSYQQNAPSAYQPARQLQINIYPDRLNYCTNPSFEVSAANWSTLGTKAASITLSQDATTAAVGGGSNALKVALAAGINPRTPVTVGTTNLVLNPNGDLGDNYLPYGAETVHQVISTDYVEGSHSIQITTQNVSDAQGFSTNFTDFMSVTGGSTYTFSAYLKKISGTTNPVIQINWYSDPVTTDGTNSSTVAITTSWTRFSVSATAPADATLATVSVYYAAGTPAGNQVNVNGMQLEQQASATPYVLGTRAPDYGSNNLPWQGAQHTVTNLIPGEHYVAYARVKLGTGCPRVVPVITSGSPGTTFPDTGVSSGTGTDKATDQDANGYWLISVPFVAISTSATVGFAADQDGMNGSAVNYWVDEVVFENGDAPGTYFDGSSGSPDYMWEQGGTSGLARSYYYQDKARKNGIITSLLSEYTIAGANIGTPQYGKPKTT